MKFAVTRYDDSAPSTGTVLDLPLPAAVHEANGPAGPLCSLTPTDAPATAIPTDALIGALSTYLDPGDESDRFVARALAEGKKIAITPSAYNDVTGRTNAQRLVRFAVLRQYSAPLSLCLRESGLAVAPEHLLLEPGEMYRTLTEAEAATAKRVQVTAAAKVKPVDAIVYKPCPADRFFLIVQDGAPLPPEVERTSPLWLDTRTGDSVFAFHVWEGFKVTPWIGGRRWITVRPGEEIELPTSLHDVAPLPDGRTYHVTREIRRRFHSMANTRRAARPAPTMKHMAQAKELVAKFAKEARHPTGIYDGYVQDYLVQCIVNGCGLPVEPAVNLIDAAIVEDWARAALALETMADGSPRVWFKGATASGGRTTAPDHPRTGWQRSHIEDAVAQCYVSTDPADMEYGALVPTGPVDHAIEKVASITSAIAPWLRRLLASKPPSLTSDELVQSLGEHVDLDGKNPKTHQAIKEIMESSGYKKRKIEGVPVYVPVAKPIEVALAETEQRMAIERMIDGNFTPWTPPSDWGQNP